MLPSIIFAGDPSWFGGDYYTDTGYLQSGVAVEPVTGFIDLFLDPVQGAARWVPLVPIAIVGIAVMWRFDRTVALTAAAIALPVIAIVSLLDVPDDLAAPRAPPSTSSR